MSGVIRVRHLPTEELTTAQTAEVRAVLRAAFGSEPEERFSDDDWEHALGGTHVVADRDRRIVGHAAVVERELHVAGRPVRTGYVEAVAVAPAEQGRGIGTRVMRAVNQLVAGGFELGALGTGSHGFYARLGWVTWRGPSFVRTADGDLPTPEDDGFIMVLRTPSSPPLALDAPISCAPRRGDVW